MPPAKKEATIILLDVGENTLASSGKGGESFFKRGKACATKIIQKKIFAKPNDEVALLLLGSEDTQNDLNRSMTGFDNIVELIPLQMPTWQMVRTLDELEPSDFSSEWVDGLVVAMNFCRNETEAKKFTNVRILLITNFNTLINDSNMDVLIKSFQDADVELLAISDCVEHTDQLKSSQFSQNPISNESQTQSQKLFTTVIGSVRGSLCHIDQAEAQLLTFEKKKSKSMPWNSTLDIGSLKINVSGYVSVQEEKFLSPFKIECTNPNTVTKLVTQYARNNQPIDKPDVEDVIKSYRYGSTLVALEEDDLYKSTEKALSCLGFTKRETILNEYLVGKGCHVILPQKNFEKSAQMLAGLVDSMKKSNMVMIARKVYRNGLNPMIVVLFPDFLDEVPYFTMIQLAFANDIALLTFPRLKTKKTEPTKEQEKAIEELVNAMDLMSAVDDESGLAEAFALETSLNPVNQHLCRTVAFRAIHPSTPLPTIDPELVAMIDVPPKIKKQSKAAMEKVEEQFPLEMIERKFKKVFGKRNTDSVETEDMMDVDESDLDDNRNTVAIGTVSPAEDFGYLLKKGERYGILADQIQTVIYDLLFRTASIQNEKILECIMMFREQSKLYAPFTYNNWIKELKAVIIQKNRLDFWQESIVKEKFGLISIEEAPISTVSMVDQRDFYEIASKDMNQPMAMITGDDDDDLDALLG